MPGIERTPTQIAYAKLVKMQAIDKKEVCRYCGFTFGQHLMDSICLGVRVKVKQLCRRETG